MKPTARIKPNARALRQLLKPREEAEAKPGRKRGPLARRIRRIKRRLSELPPRLWPLAGGLIAAGLIAWWLLAPAPAPKPASGAAGQEAQTAGPEQAGEEGARAPGAEGASPQARSLAFIRSVRLKPEMPTRTDSLKAEVATAPGAPAGLVYSFAWKVNDSPVDGAGDTLNLSAYRIRDRISVTVTPRDGNDAGFPVTSPETVLHGAPPSLNLEVSHRGGKLGDPIDLQLAGAGPDSRQLSFGLEPPLVTGMTVDRATGRITWPRAPDHQGTIRFGASVEDEHGSKVIKTFEVTVGTK